MKIQRTANAGVLLTLDDVQILLDGVCREVNHYLATPPAIARELLEQKPNVVAFTHTHADHYSPAYAQACGKEVVLPDGTEKTVSVGSVRMTALPTRHMGKAGLTDAHQSFVIQGSQSVWFLGDAAPTELKKFTSYPKPDVLMVPYPYISTPAALRQVEAVLPCKVVLLHLPDPELDPEGLWQSIGPGMACLKSDLCIPQLGQTLEL